MAHEKLGLKEVVAMGVGGLIGGGIFAVLGVAANISGNAAFISYFFDGIVALASGYSYVKMTEHLKEDGGSFTFLEHYVENQNIAGFAGWILIVGYVGSTAMYAFAFGSFAAGLVGIGSNGIVRAALSVCIVLLFLGINLIGVKSSGSSEDILVYVKVAILSLFGLIGLHAIFTDPSIHAFGGGLFNTGFSSVIVGAAVIFVSFEGFELLAYEYTDMEGGISMLRKGTLYSILIATTIYLLVSFVSTALLTPHQILVYQDTALAQAAKEIFHSALLQNISFLLISLAALFSTSSAINATLFGTARLTDKIAQDKQLPKLFSFRNKNGIPTRSLLIVSGLTIGLTAIGKLDQIATFASISFILTFASVNYVCFYDNEVDRYRSIPLIGLIGTVGALILLIWHLYTTALPTLAFVTGVFTVLLVFEFIFYERKPIEEVLQRMETEMEDLEKEVEKDL